MKTVVQLLLIIALFTFASTASAITFAEVGGYDNLLTHTTLSNSSDQDEIDFVNGYLGSSYTMDGFFKDETATQWSAVEDELYAYSYDFGQNAPSHFLVKIGDGAAVKKGIVGSHFLYENSNSFGVISLWDFIDKSVVDVESGAVVMTVDFTRISHIDTFGDSAPVPEPSTLLLLGTGIAGLAAYRRKKN